MSDRDRKDLPHPNNPLDPVENETPETRRQRVDKANENQDEALEETLREPAASTVNMPRSDQDFFNAYLLAHADKYGERFRVS